MSRVRFGTTNVGYTKLTSWTPDSKDFAPLFTGPNQATVSLYTTSQIDSDTVTSPHVSITPPVIPCYEGMVVIGQNTPLYYNKYTNRTYEYETMGDSDVFISYTDSVTIQMGFTHEDSASDYTESLKRYGKVSFDGSTFYTITSVNATETGVSVTCKRKFTSITQSTYTVSECDVVHKELESNRSTISGQHSGVLTKYRYKLTVPSSAVTSIPTHVSYSNTVYVVDSVVQSDLTYTILFHKLNKYSYN